MKMKAFPVAAIAIAGSIALPGCQSLILARGIARYERALDAYAQTDTTVTEVTSRKGADGRDAALVSAFFGLDNGLPERTTDRVACEGGGITKPGGESADDREKSVSFPAGYLIDPREDLNPATSIFLLDN